RSDRSRPGSAHARRVHTPGQVNTYKAAGKPYPGLRVLDQIRPPSAGFGRKHRRPHRHVPRLSAQRQKPRGTRGELQPAQLYITPARTAVATSSTLTSTKRPYLALIIEGSSLPGG